MTTPHKLNINPAVILGRGLDDRRIRMTEIYILLGKFIFGILIFAIPTLIGGGIGWIFNNKSKVAIWIGKNIYGEDWKC